MRACSKDGMDLQPGEATVKCGLCPIPGVNIPNDWKDDPNRLAFLSQAPIPSFLHFSFRPFSHSDLLYRVFDSFDGNFSLQLNDKGVSEDADPSIVQDAGYWAERDLANSYIEKLGGFEDRKGKGPAGRGEVRSGVATIISRHGIWSSYGAVAGLSTAPHYGSLL